MRAGGGKAKGAAFEREVCKRLSLWVTNGEREDIFWRSAMSGGRATVNYKNKGLAFMAACGDICSTALQGLDLTDRYFIECKHVKQLALDSFFLKQTGPLHKYWKKAVKEAAKYKREPLIIARQNGWPILIISKHDSIKRWARPVITNGLIDVTLLNTLLGSRYAA